MKRRAWSARPAEAKASRGPRNPQMRHPRTRRSHLPLHEAWAARVILEQHRVDRDNATTATGHLRAAAPYAGYRQRARGAGRDVFVSPFDILKAKGILIEGSC